LVSRPGIEAYCGRSLSESHDSGGLFHPGTAVEPLAGVGGGEATLGASACGAAGLAGAAFVGAASGAFDCAIAANGSARATPTMNAPRWRA
jgi:hypothetical protein